MAQPTTQVDVPTTSVTVRLPDELVTEIDALQTLMQARLPFGVTVSRTDVIREALKRGLPVLRAEAEPDTDK